jgi:hypothetical protein
LTILTKACGGEIFHRRASAVEEQLTVAGSQFPVAGCRLRQRFDNIE